jgi:hypothetical protein
MNNQIVTPAADNVARVSIAGYHSIISLVYDKANSTLSNSLNSVVYFQTANVDSLVSSGNVTGGNILTGGRVSATGNITGGNLITAGSGGNITLTGGNITGANVVTANTFLGNGQGLANVTNRANTAYNIVRQTAVSLDNIQLQVASNGLPQISAVSSNISTFWSTFAVLTGGNSSSTNTGGTANVGIWTNIGSSTLGSGGDTIVATIQDQTGEHVYRGTFVQTAGAGNASIVIERLM